MATGYGVSNKGKHNGAGEELQDIDWDAIPPDKRGMGKPGAGQPQPKMKPDAVLAEPDPFNESQLAHGDETQVVFDDDCQLPMSERKKISSGSMGTQEGTGTSTEADLDKQDDGAELGGAQVKTGGKKVPDPTGGVKVKKAPLPKR